MQPKSPGTSYSGKPFRRLKLPKIGPAKTQSLFEEYFYAFLAVIFFVVTILAKAGGMSGFNAVVVGAWIAAILWFASQWRGYLSEKAKAENGKALAANAEPQAEAPKGPLPLPPGMKPMIGPQWPVKRGPWPVRSGQLRPASTPTVQGPGSTNGQTAPAQGAQAPGNEKRFVYERPTLPDRKPRLPNNWIKPDKKKPKL